MVLGETGVGKSTFVNAFGNYCSYESLEDAVKDGGFFPIPSTFTVTDPRNGELIIISSEGQILASTHIAKVGESVTQYPCEYVFVHADTNTVIKLIDTPGLFATGDVETSTHDRDTCKKHVENILNCTYGRDKQHVDNILNLLSAYDEIHAFLILMNANGTRLNIPFLYTLSEIFKRLDKSACNNVIFIFTNAASSKFKTNKTQPLLRRFLKDNNLPIALPPEERTIYCFENDTVQYIAECNNDITHDEDDEADVHRSWERSVKSTKELLDYLFSLEPHSVAGIRCIYDATHMVSTISKLLLEIMMCNFRDVNNMEEQKKRAKTMKENIENNPTEFASEELKRELRIEKTTIVWEPLDHTRVVCESPDCATYVKGHAVSPRVCYQHQSQDAFLWFHMAMRHVVWIGNCGMCDCGRYQHRVRWSETKVISRSVYEPNSEVIDKIVSSNEALKEINEGISRLDEQIEQSKADTDRMMDICAQLNALAQQNALVKESADDELLGCLENERQIYAKSEVTNEKAKHLAEQKSQYEQHVSKAAGSSYDVKDLEKLEKQLYELPTRGQDIKKALDVDKEVRRKLKEEAKKSGRNFIINTISSVISFVSAKWSSV